MKVWKVSYVDLETRAARRPFFKHVVLAEGINRMDAISRVHAYYGNSGRYGEFKASESKTGEPAMSMFKMFKD